MSYRRLRSPAAKLESLEIGRGRGFRRNSEIKKYCQLSDYLSMNRPKQIGSRKIPWTQLVTSSSAVIASATTGMGPCVQARYQTHR